MGGLEGAFEGIIEGNLLKEKGAAVGLVVRKERLPNASKSPFILSTTGRRRPRC
jgi:hypothetical protein